jgi:hypothetical protein
MCFELIRQAPQKTLSQNFNINWVSLMLGINLKQNIFSPFSAIVEIPTLDNNVFGLGQW